MSQTTVAPYLTFSGRCEEALEFYRKAVDARVEMIMRFNETPDPVPEGVLAPGFENKVMHASFRVGESLIMASDGCDDRAKFGGFSLSLLLPDESLARKYFDALSDGGRITMPLGKTFWSPLFGMLEDRFGVGWMINVFDPNAEGCA
jgi:PhnB protein